MTIAGSRARTLIIAVLAAAIASTTAAAQDAPPKDTVKKVAAVINLGFVYSSGNSNITTLTAGDSSRSIGRSGRSSSCSDSFMAGPRVSRRRISSRSECAASARSVRMGDLSRCALLPRSLAGISQRFGEQTGALYHAIIAPKDVLDFEAGLGFTQERSTERSPLNNDFPNGRVASITGTAGRRRLFPGDGSNACRTSRIRTIPVNRWPRRWRRSQRVWRCGCRIDRV